MNNNAGFSLAELMLVMALTAIVIGFAIPSYHSIIANTRMTLACHQLAQAISTAREAALNHHRDVMLCASLNGRQCDGRWTDGQLVAFLPSKAGIAFFPALPTSLSVEWRANLAQNQFLRFTPRGLSAGQWGSFWLNTSTGGTWGRVTVNALGQVSRVRIQ